VTGATLSDDFPTVAPFDESYSGSDDAFVVKFSPIGSSVIYSTYLGGSSLEYDYEIAVDGSGAAYATGTTESSDFPTLNSYQGGLLGWNSCYVTKLSADGSLAYSTYLRGYAGSAGGVLL